MKISNKTMSNCLLYLEELLHMVAGKHTNRFYRASAFKMVNKLSIHREGKSINWLIHNEIVQGSLKLMN